MLLNVIQPHLESELLRLPAVVGGPVAVNLEEEQDERPIHPVH